MTRTFRSQLVFRFTSTMSFAIVGVAIVGYLAVRETLDRQIDASLLSVASIQAGSVTDDPAGEMHFHEWDLSPEEAESLRELNRYAQVWSEAGESLIRSRYLAEDLPLDDDALARATSGELVWAEARLGDLPVRSVYYPLGRLGPSHALHVLQVAAPLDARNRTLALVGYFLAGLILFVSTGTFFGSRWLADRTIRPVHDITDQAEKIGAGTLGRRISAHAETREYDRLVRVLNTMLQRIDTAFEAQRRFTADASHELRSPLTALRGELELALRRERSPEEYRRVIESALEEAERLTALAEDLLTLARSDAGEIEPRLRQVDLGAPVAKTVERLSPKAERKKIRVTVRRPERLSVLCDPELIERLVWNLVDNAIKFTTPGGRVEVTVSSADGDAILEVADTGPGVRDAARDKIFDRFFRDNVAHPSSEGTGLGLAIVRAIAEVHGGSVAVESRETGGALFRVRLPGTPASVRANG